MVQLALRGFEQPATLASAHRRACQPGNHRSRPHGVRARSAVLTRQLELLDWAPRCLAPPAALDPLPGALALIASLDAALAALAVLGAPVVAVVVAAPAPALVGDDDDLPDEMPSTYGACQALGLGTDRPCPYYRCRRHLGLDVAPDGELRILIPPDELAAAPDTCAYAAARREHTPDEIAKVIGLSLGGFELVQRHAWSKIRTQCDRVVDTVRGVEMDVDGMLDCR